MKKIILALMVAFSSMLAFSKGLETLNVGGLDVIVFNSSDFDNETLVELLENEPHETLGEYMNNVTSVLRHLTNLGFIETAEIVLKVFHEDIVTITKGFQSDGINEGIYLTIAIDDDIEEDIDDDTTEE